MKNKEKKDILFLCQFFYPEYVSSAMLPYQTACAYVDNGFKVGALCGYPKEYSEEKVPRYEKKSGIEIIRLRYLQLKRSNFLGRLINYFSFTFAVIINIRRFRQYRYIITYSNPPILPIAAILANKLYGCKIIFVAYDLYPEIAIRMGSLKGKSLICKVMNWINSQLYSKAYKVVALSQDMRDFIKKNRPIDQEKVLIIPNWDTTVKQKKQNHVNRFSKEYQGKIVISYLGNMGICQDMDTLLGAIRELKEDDRIQFLLAGHGNKKEKIKEIVKKENLCNVKIYDFLKGQDFEDALEISTCAVVTLEKGLVGLCVPSKTYSYIDEEIPVIAIMEQSELTNDIEKYKYGFWVKNGAIKEMTTLLKYLAENPEVIIRAKAAMPDEIYGKHFSLEKYRELITQ